MKMLKKLALVSAISAISAGAFAMEAMDDESMAATTGQDGITINIVPDAISRSEAAAMGVTAPTMDAISLNAPAYKGLSVSEIRVHDDDGYGAEGDATANSGALVIGGGYDVNGNGNFDDAGDTTELKDRTVILAKGDKPIQINLDMIGDADAVKNGNQAMLRVEIKQPQLAIKLGNIYVANSNAAEAGRNADGVPTLNSAEIDGTGVDSKVKILDGLEIVMGESSMIIRLGNEDSSDHMITADANLIGGLTINNFALYDEFGAEATDVTDLILGNVPTSGGSIRAKSIKITNNDGTGNLTAKTSIDVGSRIASNAFSTQPATDAVADLDPATQLLFNKPASDSAAYADALASERDVQAARLFAGATYSALSAGDKATVDATSYVQTAQTAATSYASTSTAAATAAASVNTITTHPIFGSVATANLTSSSTYADVSNAATNLAASYATADSVAGRDALTNAGSGGTFTTYADAQAAAAGAPGPLQVAGAAVVNGVDSAVANVKAVADGVALLKQTVDYRKGLVEAVVSNAKNTSFASRTWGGVDTYNGLVIISQLGGANGANIAINNLAVGDMNAQVMGDIEVIGLRLGQSKIVIMGH